LKRITTAFFLTFLTLCYTQENWSIQDLNVTTFRNGDSLIEANSETNWKNCNANQQPAYYRLGPSDDSGILYNYYALIDERQLAPEGYRIPGIEDIKALDVSTFFQSADGGWKNNTSSGFFNANAFGYISDEAFEVLSAGDAGYYWTNTLGGTLKSMAFVFLNGEKGYSIMELKRESFCVVRCVMKESEAEAFEINEIALKEEIKKQKERSLIDEQKAINEEENSKKEGISVAVNINSSSGPVSEALVKISTNGMTIGSATTDEYGKATVTFPTYYGGQISTIEVSHALYINEKKTNLTPSNGSSFDFLLKSKTESTDAINQNSEKKAKNGVEEKVEKENEMKKSNTASKSEHHGNSISSDTRNTIYISGFNIGSLVDYYFLGIGYRFLPSLKTNNIGVDISFNFLSGDRIYKAIIVPTYQINWKKRNTYSSVGVGYKLEFGKNNSYGGWAAKIRQGWDPDWCKCNFEIGVGMGFIQLGLPL
jgi:uncharacterized protein (TIGR02145 family)